MLAQCQRAPRPHMRNHFPNSKMEDGNHFIIHIDHFKVLLFLINIVCNIFVWLTFGGGGVGGGVLYV